jgi:hypothetical protein
MFMKSLQPSALTMCMESLQPSALTMCMESLQPTALTMCMDNLQPSALTMCMESLQLSAVAMCTRMKSLQPSTGSRVVSDPGGDTKPAQVTKELVVVPVVIASMPTRTRLPARMYKSKHCALSHLIGSEKLPQYF